MSRYGRFQVAEPHANLLFLHQHKGEPLHEVDHEPKIAVLDQQDLIAQGIDTSQMILGARRVDALGSCTANATMAALSNVLPGERFLPFTGASGYGDTKRVEEAAIVFYHGCTDQTGSPATEWPPTDCGSSGPYIVQYAEALKLVSAQRIAHGAQNLVSLLQHDGVLMGSPWFNSWEQPGPDGFIDGDGSVGALEDAIRSGVAGGHETYLSAIPKLTLTETDVVVPEQTVLRGRNSWSESWNDHGDYLVHLSTLVALGSHCDWRQLVA